MLTPEQQAGVRAFWSLHNNEMGAVMKAMTDFGVNYADWASAIGVTPEWFDNLLTINGAPDGFGGKPKNPALVAYRQELQVARMDEIYNFVGIADAPNPLVKTAPPPESVNSWAPVAPVNQPMRVLPPLAPTPPMQQPSIPRANVVRHVDHAPPDAMVYVAAPKSNGLTIAAIAAAALTFLG